MTRNRVKILKKLDAGFVIITIAVLKNPPQPYFKKGGSSPFAKEGKGDLIYELNANILNL